MKSFLGEYQHSLDAKGRLILPADFRPALADGGVIGIGQHNCLVVFTPEEWERMAQDIGAKAREGDTTQLDASRAVFAYAREVKPDSQGRVPIAHNQRAYAGLDRDVIVAGAFNRIEIWDATRWREHQEAGLTALAAGASLPGFGI